MKIYDIEDNEIIIDENAWNKYKNKPLYATDGVVRVYDRKLNRYVPIVCLLHNAPPNHYHKFVFKDGNSMNVTEKNVTYRKFYSPNQNRGSSRVFSYIRQRTTGYELQIPWLGNLMVFFRNELDDAVELRDAVCRYIGKDLKDDSKARKIRLKKTDIEYIKQYIEKYSK
jgi:hypothetical protein